MAGDYSLRFRLWCWWNNYSIEALENLYWKEREKLMTKWLDDYMRRQQHGS